MTEHKSSASSGLIGQPAVETINAPRFNPPSMADTNIETYFMSLEFWFAASGIDAQHDSRRYNMPPNKLTELRSIVEATPANDKYAYIKAKLIEYFADSQQRRLQRVLSDMPLGDLKPSQLFNEMKRVAGNSLGEPVLLDLWATRLLPHAQAAVIASRGDAADQINIADAIVDSMVLRKINAVDYNVPNTAMAAPNVHVATAIDSIQDLRRKIAELTRRLRWLFVVAPVPVLAEVRSNVPIEKGTHRSVHAGTIEHSRTMPEDVGSPALQGSRVH